METNGMKRCVVTRLPSQHSWVHKLGLENTATNDGSVEIIKLNTFRFIKNHAYVTNLPVPVVCPLIFFQDTKISLRDAKM